MMAMDAFRYPSRSHRRKHGPRGYQNTVEYRPWLRDEFTFRCVFCLEREQWVNRIGHFHGEHFLPVVERPDLALEYDNLLYVCQACNFRKGRQVRTAQSNSASAATTTASRGRNPCQTRPAEWAEFFGDSPFHVELDSGFGGCSKAIARVPRVLSAGQSRSTPLTNRTSRTGRVGRFAELLGNLQQRGIRQR